MCGRVAFRERCNIRGPLIQASASRSELDLSLGCPQSLSFQQGQTPSTFGAFPVDVLLAHFMPDNIIVCQRPPSLTDLRRFAERGCIQVAEDLEGYFGRKRGQKVDADEVTNVRGDV